MNYKLKARGRHTYTTPRPGQYLKHPIQQLSHVLCGAGALLGREGSIWDTGWPDGYADEPQ